MSNVRLVSCTFGAQYLVIILLRLICFSSSPCRVYLMHGKTGEDRDYSVMEKVELKKLFPGKKAIEMLLFFTIYLTSYEHGFFFFLVGCHKAIKFMSSICFAD